MATLNGIWKKLKGSVGSLTFKQVNGQTVVSEKATTVKNTRTSGQQRQRTKSFLALGGAVKRLCLPLLLR